MEKRRERMKRKIVSLLGFTLAVAVVALLAGQLPAEEEAQVGQDAAQAEPKAEKAFVSCNKWLNCNSESPNFTGLCCRICRDAEGQIDWDCKPVSAEGERRDASPVGDVALGEATLTGIVTAEGILRADDGHKYKIAGTRLQVDELQRNMGRRIEVKGTVQEVEGKVSIQVASYQSMHLGDAAGADALGSCTGWMNCDQRPPNFTGTCCRQCKDKQGGKVWDCKVFSEGEHFDMAEWSK
jgi:hypothetical protein